MPLPENNTPWPPKPWPDAQQTYAVNEAWYLGDVDRLAGVYSGSDAQRPSHMKDGQPMRGGLVGGLSKLTKYFWGRPVPLGQNRTRLHLPAPADLAVLSSDLMFAEPPEVRLPGTSTSKDGVIGRNAALQDRLDAIANGPAAHATWNTMGEFKAWSGAAVLLTRWDREVADRPWLESAAADVVVPEFRGGMLSALTLWSEWTEDANPTIVSTYWRHLERHERGAIIHALYRGSKADLGVQVPLQSQARTEHLDAIPDTIADGLTVIIPTGIDMLTASYNINMPSREWRRMGDLAHAGRSDYQGLLPLFDTLDEVWSSWVRDIRLARARLVVPEGYLDYTGPGQASQFDPDQEIFSPVAAMFRPGEQGIELQQPLIRVEEHERTVYAVYREILRAAGYSSSAWGDYGTGSRGGGVMTAAEVADRDKASERTRDKKALYDRRAIAEQAAAALHLDAVVFGGRRPGPDDLPVVTFPPASQVDPLKNSQTIANLRAASAVTVRTAVEMAHPDWESDRVDQEVDGILTESGQRVPDPTTLTE